MAAGAVLTVLLAGSAEAAKPKAPPKLRSASATVTASGTESVASATATCPAKTKAVAGGYTTSIPALPPAASPHWLNVHESQRVGEKAWRVSGVDYLGGTDSLTAYVYCEALKTKVRTASQTVALPTTANTGTTGFATCPEGSKPLSGGFSLPPASAADASYVSRSIAGNRIGWVVDATRLAVSGARSLISYAYCAEVPAIKTKSAARSVLGPAGSLTQAATGRCAKRASARGGGFATSTPVGGLLATALVYETRRLGRGWTSSAVASGATTSSTLVTNAYCR
ncbi:MAG: hypothetical protein M3O25_10730 [Actinomycetota bacterium]|nr:hypothetical protein [Actinomycetota bacterium]